MSTEVSLITRNDGSQVKIVCELMFGRGLHPSIGTYVLKRESAEHQWTVCNDRPTPVEPWSVDGYIKHGRPEILRLTTFAERVKTYQALLARYPQIASEIKSKE